MLLIRSLKKASSQGLPVRYCSSSVYKYPSREDEYDLTPQYPAIERTDASFLANKELQNWYLKIKRQPTIEEKLFEVNVPRHWGWKCFMIHEGIIPFNNLEFAQHMTRTHLIEIDALPGYYADHYKKCSSLAEKIKKNIVESIEYQLQVRREELVKNRNVQDREKEITKIIIEELNRSIISNISAEEGYMKTIQTDFSPRIEAAWQVNSLVETVVKKEKKYGIPLEELPEEYLDRPSDKFIQYVGHPILQLRHTDPLPKLIDRQKANIFNYSVPVYNYDPHVTLGYNMERRHVTNIPGFWPGDDREFSFLSYHFLNHIKHRPTEFGEIDAKHALYCQAIFASFGWLMPLACYQGFSCYNDVTYPLLTQTVVTDGRQFAFGIYQLNTTELHFANPYENPASNICWITPVMQLFKEYENGRVKGLNEKVLTILLQLYSNRPLRDRSVEFKPYLGEKVKCIADYEDDEKREWLEKKFKHIFANKPPSRPDLMYELMDWERIYKIQFRMRPLDARRRPFELRQNPYHMKMSDVKEKYIPKALRKDNHLPKWRQRKREKAFYPE